MSDNWFAINLVGDVKIKSDVVGEYLAVLNSADSDGMLKYNLNK
jgi:hypothetical protein